MVKYDMKNDKKGKNKKAIANETLVWLIIAAICIMIVIGIAAFIAAGFKLDSPRLP